MQAPLYSGDEDNGDGDNDDVDDDDEDNDNDNDTKDDDDEDKDDDNAIIFSFRIMSPSRTSSTSENYFLLSSLVALCLRMISILLLYFSIFETDFLFVSSLVFSCFFSDLIRSLNLPFFSFFSPPPIADVTCCPAELGLQIPKSKSSPFFEGSCFLL